MHIPSSVKIYLCLLKLSRNFGICGDILWLPNSTDTSCSEDVIAFDKVLFSSLYTSELQNDMRGYQENSFYFYTKTYVVGTH